VLIALLVLLGIDPTNRWDYLLEHVPTVALFIFLILFDRQVAPLSNCAATLIFVFLVMHVFGSHYLYSNVPYDAWTESVFGTSISSTFEFERNHYDRLVHFMFGILLVFPMREILTRYLNLKPVAGLVVAVTFLAVFSKLYELVEWGLAMVMSPEAAERYNGQQGDVFDAHKDMALAFAGSVFSAIAIWVSSKRRRR
jgi:putative membrane protein